MAEKRQTSVVEHHESHGNSVAAWTAVAVIMFGFLLLVISGVNRTLWLFIASVVVIVIGAILGKVLSAMGFGASGKPTT